MTTIPVSEAKQKLEELSERVFREGQSFALTKDEHVVALLTPPPKKSLGQQRRWLSCGELAEVIARRRRMPPEEAETFARDVEAAIVDGNQITPEVEWPS